ncbi:hypothetical protein [Streptomyces sp. NPDC002564]|uniref:hypothetical protein n=1 Tax=Streptomyces sp. NPDC002564 TaxID=3364649 RepID=UPI0036C84314
MKGRDRPAVRDVLVWTVLLFALYVVFVGPLSVLELGVGAGLAVLGALAGRAVRRASGVRVGGLGRCLAALRVWPVACATELAGLCGAVARALRGRPADGRWRTVRLRPDVGPAWAATLLSSTPGAYVVDSADRDLTLRSLTPGTSRLERALCPAEGTERTGGGGDASGDRVGSDGCTGAEGPPGTDGGQPGADERPGTDDGRPGADGQPGTDDGQPGADGPRAAGGSS